MATISRFSPQNFETYFSFVSYQNFRDQTRRSKVTMDENGQLLAFIKDLHYDFMYSIFNG